MTAAPASHGGAAAAGYALAVGGDGIARLTFDLPGKVNVMNDDFMAAMDEAIARLEAARASLRGVIVASAKKTFFAGGDLKLMGRARPGEETFLVAHFNRLKGYFRRLERLGVPTVAALTGSALGGGLELALACHRRIALRRDDIAFGLPEVGFGILPGAGGVVRLAALIGPRGALDYLLSGKRVAPAQALADGVIDALADDQAALFAAATTWIEHSPSPVQPWDAAPPAQGADALDGAPQPDLARQRIVEIVRLAQTADVDASLSAETDALVELMVRPETAALIAQFFARDAAKAKASSA